MDIFINTVTSLVMASMALFGIAPYSAVTEATTVEIGLREVSPKGDDGGFAVPASGCGVIHDGLPVHDCATSAPDISVDKPLVRYAEPVRVSWDPKSNVGCVLSSTVTRLTTSPNPSTLPNANAVGSRIDAPISEVLYTITCTGSGNTDTARVKVLPRIQET